MKKGREVEKNNNLELVFIINSILILNDRRGEYLTSIRTESRNC